MAFRNEWDLIEYKISLGFSSFQSILAHDLGY